MTNPSADTTWRAMTPDDLAAVITLAGHIHTDYPEDAAVFAERLALCPTGCLVLDGPLGVVGYLISHPWQGPLSPPLNTLLGALPTTPESWYIHDVALAPAARGAGHAGKVVPLVEGMARQHGLPRLSLTSTGQALSFWHRQGFVDEVITEAERAILASYDPQARLMTRSVA